MARILCFVLTGFLASASCAQPALAAADDAGLAITQPRSRATLDPNRTYRVTVTCGRGRAALPTQSDRGFFIQTSVAATHLLAISDSNTNTFPAPDRAKAFIAVYAISGDQPNRTSYVNKACSTSFFLTARKPLYLLSNALRVETNTLGPGLKIAEAGLTLLSSAWPIFSGLPIPAMPGTNFKAVKDSSGPLAAFVANFNNGANSTEPYRLREGTYTISTDYSRVTVKVEPLISIVGLGNKDFTAAYEDAIAQVFKDKLTYNMTSDQAAGSCLAISNQMRDQLAISSLDIAYGLLRLAVDGGLQQEQIVRCLGTRYAGQAVQFVRHDWDSRQKFDNETIATVLPGETVTIAQPSFTRSIKSRLEDIMGALRIYATGQRDPTDADKKALSAFLAPIVNVHNKSDQLTIEVAVAESGAPEGSVVASANGPFRAVANWKLMDALKGKYTRYGCLFHDNNSLALFLAIPEKAKESGRYQLTDVLALRLWLNSKQQISQLEIAFDGADIGAAIKANNSACGPNVVFGGPG